VGVTVQGDAAFLAAGGVVNFGTTPYTLVAGGSITKVDLRNRRVLTTRAMPTGSYGASTKLGGDGFLYVSLYDNILTFTSRVLKLRADDLSNVTTGASPFLPLKTTSGADALCGTAVADQLGRVHCIINAAGSVTSLYVFNTAGSEIRRVPAGQGGVDLALR
jgi:hypothetical protein